MTRAFFGRLALALSLLLSACIEIQPLAAPPQPSLAAPPGVTATAVTPTLPVQTSVVQWFPATRTPTPMNTLPSQPTAQLRPALGAILLEDDFSGERQWNVGQSAAGAVSYGQGRLTLATGGQKGMLVSIRGSANYTDTYTEITSSLSLCRGADNYGLLLRATSLQDYYRLLINCNGQVRFERVVNGYVALLQDWMYSGQVPPGAPLVLRLGVWTAGGDMRVYINDIYQFAVTDATLPAGTVGVFARSAGVTPLTVDFSGLTIYQVEPARALAVRTSATLIATTPAPGAAQPALVTPTPAVTATPTPTLAASATRAGPTPSITPVFMHPATQRP